MKPDSVVMSHTRMSLSILLDLLYDLGYNHNIDTSKIFRESENDIYIVCIFKKTKEIKVSVEGFYSYNLSFLDKKGSILYRCTTIINKILNLKTK